MNLPLPRFVDERFLNHRLRATSTAGIASAVLALLLFMFRFYHDHVFRGAPENAPAAEGGFSFDQFFSDSPTSGVDADAASSEAGRTGGSADAHDIEQFTAWLEGLKKK